MYVDENIIFKHKVNVRIYECANSLKMYVHKKIRILTVNIKYVESLKKSDSFLVSNLLWIMYVCIYSCFLTIFKKSLISGTFEESIYTYVFVYIYTYLRNYQIWYLCMYIYRTLLFHKTYSDLIVDRFWKESEPLPITIC